LNEAAIRIFPKYDTAEIIKEEKRCFVTTVYQFGRVRI